MMNHYQKKHLNNIEPLGLDQMVVNVSALGELAIHWCVVHCWLVVNSSEETNCQHIKFILVAILITYIS
jgi:hypothetical protein